MQTQAKTSQKTYLTGRMAQALRTFIFMDIIEDPEEDQEIEKLKNIPL